MNKTRIYLDHAATTPVDADVVEAMLPYFSESFGNASSLHSFGAEAKEALETARARAATAIGCGPEEIVFTSGGSESDNLALKGIAALPQNAGKHLVTSSIEHPAILKTAAYLESKGYTVTYLPVDADGIVDPADLEAAITDDTFLVSVMHANNEIGTIQPLKELGRICHIHDIVFHSDAVQSVGKVPVDVDDLAIDLLSASSHKLHGPKGVGFLYVRKGTELESLVHGGSHEHGHRAGTENVAGIVGFGKALELALQRLEDDMRYVTSLRERLIDGVLEIEETWLNGDRERRLPNNANFGFRYIEGEGLLLHLDMAGIAASTGSACSSHSLEPSHVLSAIGMPPEESHGSLRLTLGGENTADDIDAAVDALKDAVTKLRAMSPFTPDNPEHAESVHCH